jgi:hypothetical protein
VGWCKRQEALAIGLVDTEGKGGGGERARDQKGGKKTKREPPSQVTTFATAIITGFLCKFQEFVALLGASYSSPVNSRREDSSCGEEL